MTANVISSGKRKSADAPSSLIPAQSVATVTNPSGSGAEDVSPSPAPSSLPSQQPAVVAPATAPHPPTRRQPPNSATYTDYSSLPEPCNIEDVLAIPSSSALGRRMGCDPSGGRRGGGGGDDHPGGGSGGSSRKGPCPHATFPAKLHEILSRPDLTGVISWLPHGRSWKILDQPSFVNRVMPHYFAQSKIASFMRQVNGWGFVRITRGDEVNSYYSEFFLRGKPSLARFMERRPAVRDLLGPEPNFLEYETLPPNPEVEPGSLLPLPPAVPSSSSSVDKRKKGKRLRRGAPREEEEQHHPPVEGREEVAHHKPIANGGGGVGVPQPPPTHVLAQQLQAAAHHRHQQAVAFCQHQLTPDLLMQQTILRSRLVQQQQQQQHATCYPALPQAFPQERQPAMAAVAHPACATTVMVGPALSPAIVQQMQQIHPHSVMQQRGQQVQQQQFQAAQVIAGPPQQQPGQLFQCQLEQQQQIKLVNMPQNRVGLSTPMQLGQMPVMQQQPQQQMQVQMQQSRDNDVSLQQQKQLRMTVQQLHQGISVQQQGMAFHPQQCMAVQQVQQGVAMQQLQQGLGVQQQQQQQPQFMTTQQGVVVSMMPTPLSPHKMPRASDLSQGQDQPQVSAVMGGTKPVTTATTTNGSAALQVPKTTSGPTATPYSKPPTTNATPLPASIEEMMKNLAAQSDSENFSAALPHSGVDGSGGESGKSPLEDPLCSDDEAGGPHVAAVKEMAVDMDDNSLGPVDVSGMMGAAATGGLAPVGVPAGEGGFVGSSSLDDIW